MFIANVLNQMTSKIQLADILYQVRLISCHSERSQESLRYFSTLRSAQDDRHIFWK